LPDYPELAKSITYENSSLLNEPYRVSAKK